jgi:hypothetical protein
MVFFGFLYGVDFLGRTVPERLYVSILCRLLCGVCGRWLFLCMPRELLLIMVYSGDLHVYMRIMDSSCRKSLICGEIRRQQRKIRPEFLFSHCPSCDTPLSKYQAAHMSKFWKKIDDIVYSIVENCFMYVCCGWLCCWCTGPIDKIPETRLCLDQDGNWQCIK